MGRLLGLRRRASVKAGRASRVALALLCMCACHPLRTDDRPLASLITRRDRFRVADVLVYTGKPETIMAGMLPMTGSVDFWSGRPPRDTLDEPAFRATMRRYRDYEGLFYLDIETWPMCGVPERTAVRNLARFSRAIDIVREVAPRLTFGIYGELPAHDYWAVVGDDPARRQRWLDCSARVAPLASKVDVIFPSLYTFYDDSLGWKRYAEAMIDAARAYGKPVYPFLMPMYHESNPRLGWQALPGPTWRGQLEFVRRHADGVVLWNAWRQPWVDDAAWAQETRAFMKTLR